jgi:hypothetical protein
LSAILLFFNTGFIGGLGIQRTLFKNRIDDISDYVKNIDATFPTNIIYIDLPMHELGKIKRLEI